MRTADPRLRQAALALPVVVLVSVLAGLAAGAAAGTLIAIAATCAVALSVRVEPDQRALIGRASTAALLALPGALVIYFAFNGGGFFPFAPAVVAVFVAFLLLLRILFAADPFEGFSRLFAFAAGAFALYCAWSLLSYKWSHAAGRAFVETDRSILYLLLLVLFGSLGRTSERLRWLARSIALGIAVVCVVALITRVLPHVWPITPNIVNNRLSYPVTYWNTLGLLAAMGCILALHLTCSLSEPLPVRIVAAAALPMLATTLLFTFSRGSIAACAIGIALYVLLGRPRGLLTGAIATAPAVAISLVVAYDANLLATRIPTTVGAVAQGRHVAIVCALCMTGAAILRALFAPVDARLRRFRASPYARRASRVAFAGAGALLIVVLLAAGVPHRIDTQYHRFVNNKTPAGNGSDLRQRLTDPSNNGRLELWKVAVREFRHSRLHGDGSGTFALAWAIHRPADATGLNVVNAHSLYVENLGELGLVGFLLLMAFLGGVALALVRGALRRSRTVHAALLAVLVAWAFEAGFDWQWQMPVVTALLFPLAGLALALPSRLDEEPRPRAVGWRAAAALACAGVGVIPFLVALSQDHLDNAVSAFQQQDCGAATRSARAASNALAVRAEPYEILGYCALQAGRTQLAVAEMSKAVKRDPDNWEYRYGLAVAKAANGRDPRPDVRMALRLGPFQVLPDNAAALFDTSNPQAWRRRAPQAPLPSELAS